MVKTRAQFSRGLTTPSPKSAIQTCKESDGNAVKSFKRTRKTRGGTKGKEKLPTQNVSDTQEQLAETPEQARRGKATKRKSITSVTPRPPGDEQIGDGTSKGRKQKSRTEQVKYEENEDGDEIIVDEDECVDRSKKKNRNGKTSNKDFILDVNDLEDEEEEDEEGEDQKDGKGGGNKKREDVKSKERRTSDLKKMKVGKEEDVPDAESEDDDADADHMEEEEELHEDEEEDEHSDDLNTSQRNSTGPDRGGAVEEDEDDSDAPEDVSFSKSRQAALESISQTLQQSKRSEEAAKEKRRKRDQRLKLQKERKKISLERSRLPDDFLAEVAELAKQKQEVNPDPATTDQPKPVKSSQHTIFGVDDDEDDSDVDDENFIPFAEGDSGFVDGFEVRNVSHHAPPVKSDSALDFLQKQLYGSKVKRESVNKHQSRLLKRQGQPAMIFLNPKAKKKKRNHLKNKAAVYGEH